MFRVVQLGGKLYSLSVDIEDSEEQDNIKGFVEERNVVILVEDLDALNNIGIDPSDVISADGQ